MTAAQLKASILQLAIEGKLVEQDPTDKPVPVPPFDGEVPFDVPENWVWVRLDSIAEVGSSKRVYTSEVVTSGIPFYRGTEVGALAEGQAIEPKYYITKKHYHELIDHTGKPAIGDLLMPSICPDGRVWRVDTDEPFYFKDGRVLWVHFNTDYTYSYYVHQALKSRLINDFKNIASGTTFAELKIFLLKEILIPLPPLVEQKRIVEKIEALLPRVTEYGEAVSLLTTLNESFPAALKKSILQAAVEGKLADQDPHDVPVDVPEFEGETPFDVPEGWKWSRLRNVMQLISGRDLTPDMYNANEIGIPYLTGASNFENGSLIINRWTPVPQVKAAFGDLLITCKGTVGAMAFLQIEEAHIARQIMAVRALENLCFVKYMKVFLETYVAELNAIAKSMIPGISRNDLLDALIPLPPLAEQQRIVARVEELLAAVEGAEFLNK